MHEEITALQSMRHPQMGAMYPEVTDVLLQAGNCKGLNCQVALNALPQVCAVEELARSAKNGEVITDLGGQVGREVLAGDDGFQIIRQQQPLGAAAPLVVVHDPALEALIDEVAIVRIARWMAGRRAPPAPPRLSWRMRSTCSAGAAW